MLQWLSGFLGASLLHAPNRIVVWYNRHADKGFVVESVEPLTALDLIFGIRDTCLRRVPTELWTLEP
jgi:hypothetical protein